MTSIEGNLPWTDRHPVSHFDSSPLSLLVCQNRSASAHAPPDGGGAPEWARARSRTTDDGAACVCDGFFRRFPFSHMYVGTTRPAAHTVHLHVAPSGGSPSFTSVSRADVTQTRRSRDSTLKRTASNRRNRAYLRRSCTRSPPAGSGLGARGLVSVVSARTLNKFGSSGSESLERPLG